MRVKINTEWFDTSDDSVMFVLSDEEKNLIYTADGERIAFFPNDVDLNVQERYEWMEGELPDFCFYFINDALQATGLVPIEDFSFADGKLEVKAKPTAHIYYPMVPCLLYVWDRRIEVESGKRSNITHCYRTNGNIVASLIDGISLLQLEVKEA